MANRYIALDTLDAGGQGQVRKARREADGLMVAVKVMVPDPNSPDPEADKARFAREIRCQTTLHHPNIAEIIEANTNDDPPWFVMPLATYSLRKVLQSRPLQEHEAVGVFRHILNGMEYAHSEGVLHRDLKPENVLLMGGWRIADFGLSRRIFSGSATITVANQGMGTLAYAAPEQWVDAHSVDERADVYALGKILYELLTGCLPFPSLDMAKVPSKYRWVITRATEYDPDRRYRTVAALAAELDLTVTGASALVMPIEQGKQLLQRMSAGAPAAVAELDQLLVTNQDDEVLYKEFVVALPLPVLVQLLEHRPEGLRTVVQRFVELTAGSHPWSYTDRIADFLANVHGIITDTAVRRAIMERLLVVGADHNRFYVGEVFARLVAASTDPSDVMAIAQVMRDHPDAVPFHAYYVKQHSLPQQLLKVIDELGGAEDQ